MSDLAQGAVARPGSSRDYRTGTWRSSRPVHVHLAAPCHSACPAGEDPQAYIALLQEGRVRDAWEELIGVNPLPAVTGRVCHHPCEHECNRSKLDQPVAIHSIERFLGDEAIRHSWALPLPERELNEKVAVVGAGPAGLAAAYHLWRRGYRVALFDQNREAGGMLRSAIPPYRLPRAVLEAEVSRLLATGIEFKPHQKLGRDLRLDDLYKEYAAVFLAPGCHKPRAWSVDGAETVDARFGLGLLFEWLSLGIVSVARRRVIVHGGGNTAIDAARVLRWSGASEVHVVTASALPSELNVPPNDRMAAFPREVEQALDEGVTIHPRHTLTRLIVKDGHLIGAEVTAVGKLAGADKAMHRIAVEGTERVIDADMVVPATGEVVEPEGLENVLSGGSFVAIDELGQLLHKPGVFAGGDAVGSRGTVSACIGDGRRAAIAIDRYLQHQSDSVALPGEPIGIERMNLNYFDHVARVDAPLVSAADRLPDKEIEQGLKDAEARSEAVRCLSCGNCLACDNC